MNALFLKAAFALLVLPGTMAVLIPWLLVTSASVGSTSSTGTSAGIVAFVSGTLLLLWCVREFYVRGRGTLAPWAPPRTLVVTGPYRFSRNPIYVAMLLILSGWALVFQSLRLTAYAALMAVLFHLRVIFGEEPRLARVHPAQWAQYKRGVPRWLGRVRL